MVLHISIFFQGGLPEVEEILKRLENHSGLKVEWDSWLQKVSCNEITMPIFLCKGGPVEYIITSFDVQAGYLESAIIQCMIELGGDYEGELEPWAKKPWEEVKNIFK